MPLARLPAAREKAAATVVSGRIVIAGGLSNAGPSTSTVFAVSRSGTVRTLAPLAAPLHDAAAAAVNGRVLVFGGGQAEGSDQIVQADPGPARQVGRLPQPLSDLASATLGASAYLVGGWNGTHLNTTVYRSGGSGTPSPAGRLPLGVRYPAAAAVGGRIVVAGGEDAAGAPTRSVTAFDPHSGRASRVATLPAAIDHAPGVAYAGRFYLVGGLRAGSPSNDVLSWAPGERRFVQVGTLPTPLADAAAVPFAGGIALVGGRGPSGPVDTVLLLRPR